MAGFRVHADGLDSVLVNISAVRRTLASELKGSFGNGATIPQVSGTNRTGGFHAELICIEGGVRFLQP